MAKREKLSFLNHQKSINNGCEKSKLFHENSTFLFFWSLRWYPGQVQIAKFYRNDSRLSPERLWKVLPRPVTMEQIIVHGNFDLSFRAVIGYFHKFCSLSWIGIISKYLKPWLVKKRKKIRSFHFFHQWGTLSIHVECWYLTAPKQMSTIRRMLNCRCCFLPSLSWNVTPRQYCTLSVVKQKWVVKSTGHFDHADNPKFTCNVNPNANF